MRGSADAYRILVVDDDARYLDLLQFALTAEGYRVDIAPNALAAHEMAVLNKPDVIVTDIAMPEQDGYALAAGLKSNPRTAQIPLIFVSARAQADRNIGYRIGAAEYVTKPFSVDELVKKIRSLVCEAKSKDSV